MCVFLRNAQGWKLYSCFIFKICCVAAVLLIVFYRQLHEDFHILIFFSTFLIITLF